MLSTEKTTDPSQMAEAVEAIEAKPISIQEAQFLFELQF